MPAPDSSTSDAATRFLEALQERLGYRFQRHALLQRALTHRSFGSDHNERLEFLGDTVLGLAVSTLLFERFDRSDEGDLSRLRANLVKQESLHAIALSLQLSDGLRLGEGEWRSGGAKRPSILADAFEAVLGAVYVDGGYPAAEVIVRQLFVPVLDRTDPRALGKDAKTELQEWLQARKFAVPDYRIVATHGQAHRQRFDVACEVEALGETACGSGASRRAAEQAAARAMLGRLHGRSPE